MKEEIVTLCNCVSNQIDQKLLVKVSPKVHDAAHCKAAKWDRFNRRRAGVGVKTLEVLA